MKMHWKKFGRILKAVAPIVLAAAGVPPRLIPLVEHAIVLAESKPGTGAEKKALALDAIRTGIAAAEIGAGRPVVDPGVTAIVSDGIDVAVRAVNAAKGLPIVE